MASIKREDQQDQELIKLDKEFLEIQTNISRAADIVIVSEWNRESGTKRLKRRLNDDLDEPISKRIMLKEQGLHGCSSTDRVKAEILVEAKRKHNKLFLILDDLITEDSFDKIKRMAQAYIDMKTCDKAKNMYQLLFHLEEKGVIDVGKYDRLIKIMTDAEEKIGVDEVQKTARDIEDIMKEQSKMSKRDAYIWNKYRIHPSPGILHKTVLYRCLPALLRDLDFWDIHGYLIQKDVINYGTRHDILEQPTRSGKIRNLIRWIGERDQDTYAKFKECLVLANQTYLKDKLEEEEAAVAMEVKQKHEGTKRQKRRLSDDQDEPESKTIILKEQGLHGCSSTDRVKAEILVEAKRKHNQLFAILSGLITEDRFKKIKRMAKACMNMKTCDKAKNMYQLLFHLEEKGVIDVGKYDRLVEIMTDAGVGICVDEIQETARDIKYIMQELSEMSIQDVYIWNKYGIHPSPGILHKTVLYRCLPALLRDLDFLDIFSYLIQKDVINYGTRHDILAQRTESARIIKLIKSIQERDQDTYEKFKECLVQSEQTYLKDMLEEEETAVTTEMKEKHEEELSGIQSSLVVIGNTSDTDKAKLETQKPEVKTIKGDGNDFGDLEEEEELSGIQSSLVVIGNTSDTDKAKLETQKPEVKTIKGDGNDFGDLEEEGTATGYRFADEDIRKAWKSVKKKLLQEVYPKSTFSFLIKEGILSDDECQAMHEKTRREMTEEILQRVEEKLPNAFFVLHKALRDTDQDKAVKMMIEIIKGTSVSKTTAPVLNLSSFKVTMGVKREGSAIDNTEKTLLSIFKKDPVVYSFNLCSDIKDVTKGSIIIRLHPRRKHALEILKLSCRHGGMKDFMLYLLKKRVVFDTLPPGEISIDVEVCCDQGEESVSESTLEPQRDLGYENFEVSENPQVIKGNLLLHAGILLEEICPLPLKKTFIDRGILDKTFFENLKQYERRDRVFRFLDEVCTLGSEAAMLALVDSLKASNNEALAQQLCSVKKKTKNLMDTAPEDIRKNWKSMKARLLDELNPKSILTCFVNRGILSDDEVKALEQKKRREISGEILQRVEENLHIAFPVFLEALRNTDQEKAVDMMTKIINGTYVSKTTDQVYDSLVDVEVKDSNTNAVDGELCSNHLEVCIGSNDDDQVDDSLVEVVGENMNTNDEDGLSWSCHLKVLIRKNDDDNVRKRTEVSKKGKHRARENEPDKRAVKYPHKHASIGLKSGHGPHLFLDDQRKKVVSQKHLRSLSSHICKEWEFLGRELGITDAKLEQIKEDSPNAKERVYQMLRTWKGLSAENATISVLHSAILKSGIVVDQVIIESILDGAVCMSMGK